MKKNRFISGIRRWFGVSDEEASVRAEQQYRMQLREFDRFSRQITQKIDKFTDMVSDCKNSNQMSNAVTAAKFCQRLYCVRNHVEDIKARFEIAHDIGKVTTLMDSFSTDFVALGASIGTVLRRNSTENMNGLLTIEQMLETVETRIDQLLDADDPMPIREEDYALVDEIVRESTSVGNKSNANKSTNIEVHHEVNMIGGEKND